MLDTTGVIEFASNSANRPAMVQPSLPRIVDRVHNVGMFMKVEHRDILNTVTDVLRDALAVAFGHDVDVVIAPTLAESAESAESADAVLVVATDAPPIEFEVAVKATVAPATVAALGARAGNRRLIIFTPRLSPAVMDACRRLGVSCADADGNAYLRAGSSVIDIQGRPPTRSQTLTKQDERRTRLASRSGLQVLFVLLSARSALDGSMRSIAAASGVSLGSVAGVLDELTQRRHLTVTSNGRSLHRARELIDLWAEGYRVRLHARLRLGRFGIDSSEWWRTSTEEVRAAGGQWGSETALWAIGANLRPVRGVVYLDAVPPALIAALRLRRDDRPDAPVELRRRFWTLPALAESDTVPTLLVYADLLADGDPRLIEAAAELRGSDADLRRLDES
jgi:hypothetical protein